MLDTYQLKSLDGLLDLDLNHIKILKINDKFYMSPLNNNDNEAKKINKLGYDIVIRCLGFKFDFEVFKK